MGNKNGHEIAQQALACAKNSDHAEAIGLYRQALELDVDQPSWVYAGLGNQLLQNKQIDDAEPVFLAACEKYPEQPHGCIGMATIAQRRGQWQLALERWNECLRKFPQQVVSSWHLHRGNALLQLGYVSEAEQVFQALTISQPDQPGGWVALAQSAKLRQDWESALTRWENVVTRFPNDTNAHIQSANILIAMGRFDEAEALFQQASEQWPDNPALQEGLARVAQNRGEYVLAATRWQSISQRFPGNLQLLADYIRSLLNVFEFNKALELYAAAAENSQDAEFLAVLADIHTSRFDWAPALEAMRSVRAYSPENLNLRLKNAELLMQCSICLAETTYLNQAIAILEQLNKDNPGNIQFKIRLANAYIRADRQDDACCIIDGLPEDYRTHRDIMELRSWRFHINGNESGAKQVWKDLLQRHYEKSVHAPIESLERIDNHTLQIQPSEILLFTVILNQLWRLPWFFDYYRKLGVTRFFVVDNGSDDGSLEFLHQQKNVHIFQTTDSYSQAKAGMRWINELVEEYGEDHWCLYVDADEALVFPGMEKFGLRYLAEYMERNGHEALFAYMIDMYAGDFIRKTTYLPGDDFPADYPYFDNHYYFHGDVRCPYRHVSGGIRRIYYNCSFQQKTPMIYGGRGIKFITSSHHVTPAIISNVTAVLLHYKMAGDFHKDCQDEVVKNRRSPYCIQRHLIYAEVQKNLGENYLYTNSFTEHYESSEMLLKLGLIQCPKQFLEMNIDLEDPKHTPE
jgi:tetratricopeptide (TPR) repeat protein